MDLMTATAVGTAAVAAWFGAAAVTALLAGRVIHERDVHDRPVGTTRLSRRMLVRR